MTMTTLGALAKTVRSKNAGVDKITFDVIFRDRAIYDHVRKSGVLTRESVKSLFNVPESRISDFVEFDPGCAIKFTLYRTIPSGSPGDPDIFGCQQYAPLLDLPVPAP
jgi:hypothetical protein